MLFLAMIKILLLASFIFFSSCANKRGISATYYNDCKEYYDVQGFYHQKCDENIVDYKEAYKKVKEVGGIIIDKYTGNGVKKETIQPNVW
jgi:hypothetical protein